MPLDLLLTTGLFALTVLGLACPLTARLALAPAEKLAATIALSLLGTYLIGGCVYVCALPAATLWIGPVLAAAQLGWNWRAVGALARDPEVRQLAAGQLLVTATGTGWLALVVSYSGGDWVGDWFGHWDRTRFFLERWPRDHLFTGFDPLTSRPPLINIVTGVFLRLSRVDFAHYQWVSTLLASLAFLPAALLARRFGGAGSAAVLAALFIVNPLFLQNATYAWTKLPTVFFVLTALVFFLRAQDHDPPPSAAALTAAALAAGLLAHYSAGPYLIALVVAWLALGWPRRRVPAWWKSTALAAVLGAAVLATWFGWAAAAFGVRPTLLSNTSVTDQAPTAREQAVRVGLNLRDTLVPHVFRDVDFSPFTQRSRWGAWRDFHFLLYQRNLLVATGSVGAIAILVLLRRRWRTALPPQRLFWSAFVAGSLILGVAAHAGRDPWGNTHICEQPLVLLGVTFLAAHWATLSAGWRRAVIAGAIVDFGLGVLLQFGTQSYLLDRWLTPDRPPADYFTSHGEFALMNLRAKHQLGVSFLADVVPAHPALVLALLGAVLALALVRARASPPISAR